MNRFFILPIRTSPHNTAQTPFFWDNLLVYICFVVGHPTPLRQAPAPQFQAYHCCMTAKTSAEGWSFHQWSPVTHFQYSIPQYSSDDNSCRPGSVTRVWQEVSQCHAQPIWDWLSSSFQYNSTGLSLLINNHWWISLFRLSRAHTAGLGWQGHGMQAEYFRFTCGKYFISVTANLM